MGLRARESQGITFERSYGVWGIWRLPDKTAWGGSWLDEDCLRAKLEFRSPPRSSSRRCSAEGEAAPGVLLLLTEQKKALVLEHKNIELLVLLAKSTWHLDALNY